ncbi:uncharacterized protein JN550_002388 [Neoarthrinium moseri]|uniref:uncharacterized protein n=1 Tax=Neoarthrinium moseri TaxID=1658444 RepID=UPI001FDB0ADF|nr:uncharacterized protein JN550_002388 [Neoarthrinium moseri]KAI1874959.1 hypothetical protein JN550_002388 [Neoarthrinium moseri]
MADHQIEPVDHHPTDHSANGERKDSTSGDSASSKTLSSGSAGCDESKDLATDEHDCSGSLPCEPQMLSAHVASDEEAAPEPASTDVGGSMHFSMDAPKKKKKKRSKPGKTRRAITGFEEFYADSPTTPDEHQENKKLYDPILPFAQRIETCIQRYRQKRRFDSPRNFLFDKYLALGGIESAQRMFQGLDKNDLKQLSAEEIREATARDVIQPGVGGSKFYDPENPEHWRVDFAIVVKGFLSRWVPENYPRSDTSFEEDNKQAADLIHNFLKYVQAVDACPEYTSQILAAEAICSIAPDELRNVRQLYKELRDPFNTAAKFLFCDGGVFEIEKEPSNDGAATKTPLAFDEQDPSMVPEKLDPFTQLVIFRLTVMDALKDSDHQAADEDPRNIRVVSTMNETYQVVSVKRRKKSEKKMLEKLLGQQDLQGKVKSAGTLNLQRSVIDHAYSNMPRPDQLDLSKEPIEAFIIDDDILAKVQPGMKLQLVVCELNIGIKFIKEVNDVRVSFDTLLPQSLMLTWKEPVESDRPAPSVDSPSLGMGIGVDDETVLDI